MDKFTLAPWKALYLTVNFFAPIVLVSLFFSFLISWLLVKSTSKIQNSEKGFLSYLILIFSFAIVGFSFGIVIKLTGGFDPPKLSADGSSTVEGNSPFKFIASLVTAISAVVALFLGEKKLNPLEGARPIGSAIAILMMIFGYFYIVTYFSMLEVL